MEVILKQDIAKLGKAGDVAKVKDGFARNFLFPRGQAVELTPASLQKLEQEKQRLASQKERLRAEAQQLKEKLQLLSLTIPALVKDGETEALYGSIAAADIAALLKEEAFEIDKSRIMLAEPIKALGIYEVPVELHPEVEAKIKVWVVKK
jgi:large subunit ribosomal protein L9